MFYRGERRGVYVFKHSLGNLRYSVLGKRRSLSMSKIKSFLRYTLVFLVSKKKLYFLFVLDCFIIVHPAACGGTLTALRGNITSPSYPDVYPRNKRCLWKITVPDGQRISLTFNHFQLEGNGYGVSLRGKCQIIKPEVVLFCFFFVVFFS